MPVRKNKAILIVLIILSFYSCKKSSEQDNDSLLKLAEENMANENYDDALIICDSLIKYGNENYEVLSIKAKAELRLRSYDSCQRTTSRIIKIFPDSSGGYFHRATLYNIKDSTEKGIPDIIRAIKINDNPDYQLQYAVMLAKLNEFEKALEILNRLIKENQIPKYVHRVYYTRGYCFEQQGKLEQAISDYDQSINLKRNEGIAFYRRALVYLKMKNKDKACEDLSTVLTLPKGNWSEYCMELQNENCK